MEVEPRRSCFTANSENLNKFINSYISKAIWEHQIKAVKDIREYFANPANYRIGICVLPTGAGKSGIAVMSTYACSAKRVLVITPSKHISKQMFINFCGENSQSYFVRRKIVSEQNFEALRPICKQVVENTENINSYFNDEIVIANAHKFGSKSRVEIDKIPYDKIDFVIVDEAHHYPADTWQLIIKHFPNAKKLFLTATPKNGENDILPDQSEHICFKMERNELVHKGIIRDVDFNDDSNSTDHQSACIVSIFK
jgi:superfamily II DNA or RNA helicase